MNDKYSYNKDKIDKRDLQFSKSVSPHPEIILPKLVDLRSKCPDVYNQGKLGSCTANAGCTCKAMLLQDEQIHLSRMFLYYTERAFEGKASKDVGASLRDTCKSIYKVGVCEETYMPYNPEKYRLLPSRLAILNAKKYKITAYKSLSSLDEIMQNIAFRQQPVLLGMDVYESFESDVVAKTGVMQMPQKNEKILGGHAVLVVGYKDIVKHQGKSGKYQLQPGYLIVRNSWGDKWGDKGYFYMPFDYVRPDYTFDYWIME
ncbi:MAG TPA: C1 family peptidase [Ruminiclostridium sp.]